MSAADNNDPSEKLADSSLINIEEKLDVNTSPEVRPVIYMGPHLPKQKRRIKKKTQSSKMPFYPKIKIKISDSFEQQHFKLYRRAMGKGICMLRMYREVILALENRIKVNNIPHVSAEMKRNLIVGTLPGYCENFPMPSSMPDCRLSRIDCPGVPSHGNVYAKLYRSSQTPSALAFLLVCGRQESALFKTRLERLLTEHNKLKRFYVSIEEAFSKLSCFNSSKKAHDKK